MSRKFKQRSMLDELIDRPEIHPQLVVENLKELDLLNRYSRGHAVSLEGVRRLISEKNRIYHIVDLGCGSGDWLLYMANWAKKNGYRLKLTGIDKSSYAINYLKTKCKEHPEITGITGDYNHFLELEPADIYHSALFYHHLTDSELVELMNRTGTTARLGFVVNDLLRSPWSYYAAKLTTRLLDGSILSKHDGPVSVLRSFKKHELFQLLNKAGIKNFKIYNRLFFRLLVVGLPITKSDAV